MSGSALPVTARDPQERKKLNHDSGDEPSENVDRSADPQRVGLTVRKTRLESARGEISRLRAENSALRDQLARQLGAQRAQQATPSVGGLR